MCVCVCVCVYFHTVHWILKARILKWICHSFLQWAAYCPFSFQSQRKAMPKNSQTKAQLHSSYMLVK